jgi:hypothetical protein
MSRRNEVRLHEPSVFIKGLLHGRYPFTHNDQHPVVSLNYPNIISTNPVSPERIDQRHSADNTNSVFPE